MREGRLGQIEHSEDIGLEGASQLLLGDVSDVLVRMLLAGIIDEYIEPAELIDRLADRELADLLVADVAGNRNRPPPFLLDDLLRLRRIIVLAKVEDSDIGTLPREQSGDDATDAAVATGDQRDRALPPIRARV